MLALILAAALSSTPATHVEDIILTAIFAAQGARAERARLGAWLDEQDQVRKRAVDRLAKIGRELDSLDAEPAKVSPFEPDAKASPFADDAKKPDPFDGPPKLFWWTTTETKTERW